MHTLLVASGNKSPVAVLTNGTVCLIQEQQLKATKNKSRLVPSTVDVPFLSSHHSRVLMADIVMRGDADNVCVVWSCEGVTHVTVWAVDSDSVNEVTSAILDKNDLNRFCVCQNKLLATGPSVCV